MNRSQALALLAEEERCALCGDRISPYQRIQCCEGCKSKVDEVIQSIEKYKEEHPGTLITPLVITSAGLVKTTDKAMLNLINQHYNNAKTRKFGVAYNNSVSKFSIDINKKLSEKKEPPHKLYEDLNSGEFIFPARGR